MYLQIGAFLEELDISGTSKVIFCKTLPLPRPTGDGDCQQFHIFIWRIPLLNLFYKEKIWEGCIFLICSLLGVLSSEGHLFGENFLLHLFQWGALVIRQYISRGTTVVQVSHGVITQWGVMDVYSARNFLSRPIVKICKQALHNCCKQKRGYQTHKKHQGSPSVFIKQRFKVFSVSILSISFKIPLLISLNRPKSSKIA